MSSTRKNSFKEPGMKRFVREVRSLHPIYFDVNLSGAAADRFREIALGSVDSTLWVALSIIRLGCEDILLQQQHAEDTSKRKRTKQTESLAFVSHYSQIHDCMDDRMPRTSYDVNATFEGKLVQPMDSNVWIRLHITTVVHQQFRA
jgi:hypothetical protein